MEFRFTNEPSPRWHGAIVARMRGPRMGIDNMLDYPDFDTWLEKVSRQLNNGEKRAMVALARRKVAAVVLYQRDSEQSNVLRIKNITVGDEHSGRRIGMWLVHNVAIEGAVDFPGVEMVVTDTKLRNSAMIDFLLANKFRVLRTCDLYGKGAGLDVVMGRDVRRLNR